MRKYTDADVARMLGWPIGATEHYIDNRATSMISFGLSTPPGSEADANAARYVLPWLRKQANREIYMMRLRAQLEVIFYEVDRSNDYPMDFESWAWFLVTLDGPTLCRACLRAVGESK